MHKQRIEKQASHQIVVIVPFAIPLLKDTTTELDSQRCKPRYAVPYSTTLNDVAHANGARCLIKYVHTYSYERTLFDRSCNK